MSTRSFICTKIGDFYKGIYVHYDGYIKGGVGQQLLEYYQDYSKIKKLIKRGDRSSLENDPNDGKVYTKSDDLKFTNLSDLAKYARDCGCEYIYFFDTNTTAWKVKEYDSRVFANLEDLLMTDGVVIC